MRSKMNHKYTTCPVDHFNVNNREPTGWDQVQGDQMSSFHSIIQWGSEYGTGLVFDWIKAFGKWLGF